ncbi:MAG: hypothetical protein Ct9H90mP30_4400 [Actinomycetota bacterium]|nr:MAG: hypothetical protein Ct9H90mP30_4400 [Actinomycetota bacterium]
MNADGVRRALWRMSHEILEQNRGLSELVLVGLEVGGVHLAQKLAENLLEIEKQKGPSGLWSCFLPRRYWHPASNTE